jgi:hypothetical protein
VETRSLVAAARSQVEAYCYGQGDVPAKVNVDPLVPLAGQRVHEQLQQLVRGAFRRQYNHRLRWTTLSRGFHEQSRSAVSIVPPWVGMNR